MIIFGCIKLPGVLDCNYNFGSRKVLIQSPFNVFLYIGVQNQSKFLVSFKQES